MMNSSNPIYQNISSMEPMFPKKLCGELSELSADIFRKAGELNATLPAEPVRIEVARLVREMNSYYSNVIEGHKTLPSDIKKALKQEFSENNDARRNQLMSVAHIRTDESLRQKLTVDPDTKIFEPEFICWLHRTFYEGLPEEEWYSESVTGIRHAITPGVLRDYNVEVGIHTPPHYPTLPKFMDRFRDQYQSDQILPTNALVAAAAAHHRLAWIHPFGDGNGRVTRLHSHAALIQAQVDSSGLWAVSRGLARSRSLYYQKLQAADQKRAGDLDGRGNLSDQGLAEFCKYFLMQILDQISFMTTLLKPSDLIARIEKYLRFVRGDQTNKQTEQLAKLLKALCLEGEIPRGNIPSLLGLKPTAGREIIVKAQSLNLITSSTPKGPIRITFPSEVIEYYFPSLFSEMDIQ